jgi:hypothetical protein
VNPDYFCDRGSNDYGFDYVGLNVTITANSREHITYTCFNETFSSWIPEGYLSDKHTFLGDGLDDDAFEVDLIPPDQCSWIFRFWGGAGGFHTNSSGEYTRVWISTNGFLAFDELGAESPAPTEIPDAQAPNTIIAAIWSDLIFHEISRIHYGWNNLGGEWSFVVTWENIVHKNSEEHLTFQIVLDCGPCNYVDPNSVWRQSKFRISYQSVSSITTDFAFGIEDQEGCKGLGGLHPGSDLSSLQQRTFYFKQAPQSSNYYLERLTLTFNDTCTQNRFFIRPEGEFLRGYNVLLNEPSTPDNEPMFGTAMGEYQPLLAKLGGIIMKNCFVDLEWLPALLPDLFRSNLSYIELRDQTHNPIPSGAYVVASVPPSGYSADPRGSHGSSVDSIVGVITHWILKDNRNAEHVLTVTAKLEYCEFTWLGEVVETPYVLCTSVGLTVSPESSSNANNNSFENATEVQAGTYTWLYADMFVDVFDFYKIYVQSQKSLLVTLQVANTDNLNLYLYTSSTVESLIAKSENGLGQNEFVHGEQLTDPGAWWYIEVNATFHFGFYNMTIGFDSVPLPPSVPYGPSSGYRYTQYSYNTSTTDPEGDLVRYEFSWGDGSPNTITSWCQSGVNATAAHSWSSMGSYQVRARAQDIYEAWGNWSVAKTVSMINRAPNKPTTPEGPYEGYVGHPYDFWTFAVDPDNDTLHYRFYWGDGNVTTYGPYDSGVIVYGSHVWNSLGTFSITVKVWDYYNKWAWSDTVNFSIVASGGGGCPFLYVWNGMHYILDNNLIPAAEMSNGTDVEDYHMLEQSLVPTEQYGTFSLYSLRINEYESEHDFFDQVKLYAVDYDANVQIAVTSDGEILTYQQPMMPLSCVDNNGTSRLSEISLMDGDVLDPSTYFEGFPNDCLILNFGRVDSSIGKLILRTDWKKMDECILVQVRNSSGEWQTVEVLVPRAYWSMEAVDLSSYIDAGEDFQVRLFWKYHHRLDYVGLDTSPQSVFQLSQAFLVSAIHSVEGNVRRELLQNDEVYVELTPAQYLQMRFLLQDNQHEKRTFILYSEGYYYTIT